MNATTVNPTAAVAAVPAPKREPLRMLAFAALLEKLGLGYFSPFVRMIVRYDVKSQWQQVVTNTVLPGVVIILFMGFWTLCSHTVHTDSQRIPTPTETWKAWQGMREFARNEAVKKKEFLASMSTIAAKWDAKAAEAKAAGNADSAAKFGEKAASYRSKYYAGPPTFGTQIMTSLLTVAIGIGAATLIKPALQSGDEPDHSDLQAGVSAGLAAHRVRVCDGALSSRRGCQHLAGIAHFSRHGNAVLFVAHLDQHGGRCGWGGS